MSEAERFAKQVATDRLVEAILEKDKHEIAAVLRSGVLTDRESAHAFVIAAQETARSTLEGAK